jgi:hypothetical protein
MLIVSSTGFFLHLRISHPVYNASDRDCLFFLLPTVLGYEVWSPKIYPGTILRQAPILICGDLPLKEWYHEKALWPIQWFQSLLVLVVVP